MAANEWIWDKESWFYLKFDGKMAEKEWVYDSHSQAWYYFKSGGYMTAIRHYLAIYRKAFHHLNHKHWLSCNHRI
ncbi:endo-beta-N-acetylglucosaminidase LytB [Streptococcus pneumoniae]|nr:endo-beta-N-acetylglucosaminidase LytB [Streptococcus pneumoniae]